MTQESFESRIKKSLQTSVAQIDSDTQQRLNQIRRNALNQTSDKTWLSSLQWMPATGIAFCSLFAIMFVLKGNMIPVDNQMNLNQTAMIELIDNPEDADTLSDPDFYLWLDETNINHAV